MKENPHKKATFGTIEKLAIVSVAAVALFMIVFPKYWLPITIASPIPPIP